MAHSDQLKEEEDILDIPGQRDAKPRQKRLKFHSSVSSGKFRLQLNSSQKDLIPGDLQGRLTPFLYPQKTQSQGSGTSQDRQPALAHSQLVRRRIKVSQLSTPLLADMPDVGHLSSAF